MDNTIIEIIGVHKKFKNVIAVKGVDLSIKQGEFVGLLGPNGAGKTTLIEMIEGIQKPDAGVISIAGKSWEKNETELHHLIGIAFQETKFTDKLTVKETLLMFASFYNLNEARVEEIVTLINLQEKKNTYTINLSGGQRQRLALGVALLHKPKVLLLDEPTTGLDPTARREVWNILEKLKRDENISMILTTHYMEEAEFLCDRIVIMDQGKFIAQGNILDLIKNYSEGEIIEFALDNALKEELTSKLAGVNSITWDIPSISGRMVVSSITAVLPNFIKYITEKSINLKALECRKITLEDLFIQMTGRSLNEN